MPSLRRSRVAVALLAALALTAPVVDSALLSGATPAQAASRRLPQPAPTDVRAVDATPTSLTVAWSGPAAAPRYRLDFATDPSMDDRRRKWTAKTQFRLADLSPDTRYWVRVRVVDGSGPLSPWSETVALRTVGETDPVEPGPLPTPGPGETLFGANYADVAAVDESVYGGRARAARIFFQGLGSRTWSQHAAVREATADGISTFVISWKERDPAKVGAFLATIPDGLEVYASFHHEPENDAGAPGSAGYDAWAAEWRRLWAVQSPVIRAEGFVPTSILMAWTVHPQSGRDVADWTPPAGTVDVFAFDGYLGKHDPAAQVARMSAAARAAGFTRTGLAETGAPTGDPNRVAKLRTMKAEILEDGTFAWALYWSSSQDGYDSRMDAAAADAWFG